MCWITFFVNTMWKDHKVHKGDKNTSFMVDEVMPFKICCEGAKIKNNPGVIVCFAQGRNRSWQSDTTLDVRLFILTSNLEHYGLREA